MSSPALPPVDLDKLTPSREAIAGTWYRVAHRKFRKTIHFFSDSIGNRFSSPSAKYGVSYYGITPESAFAETIRGGMVYSGRLLKELELEPLDIHTVEMTEIEEDPLNSAFSVIGSGARRIGAQAECFNLGTKEGYSCSQAWASALMIHPDSAGGIVYYGNQSVERCLGLFGEKQSKGVSGRLSQELNLEITATSKLLDSEDFLDWMNDCGYKLS